MMTEKEIVDISIDYASKNKSQHYSLQYLSARPSKFLDGYWDIVFKVLNEKGNEMEGPLLMVINGETGQISSMEEIIAQNIGNDKIKISNKPIIK